MILGMLFLYLRDVFKHWYKAIFKKDPYMATVQELTDAANSLNAAVNRAVPILQDAGNRINPADLDAVRDSINSAATNLTAALPPQ